MQPARAPGALLALLCLTACATVHEAAGDEALAAGRSREAIAEYTRALSDTPILDYDFERIRDKRKRLVEGEWGPKLDALEAERTTTEPVAFATKVIDFRRAARSAATTRAFALRIDGSLASAVAPSRLAVTDPSKAADQVSALLELFAHARRQAAPLTATDSIAAAVATTAATTWPAPGPDEGLQQLERLLRFKSSAREQQLPTTVDAALDARLAQLDGATFPPATPALLETRFALSLELRARARALGAPPAAVALADRIHEDALALLLTAIEEEVQAHRHLAAVERLTPLAAKVEDGHPLRARLATLKQEGAVWHRARAKALPAGYRRVLHHELAFSLGGVDADLQAARSGLDALASDWKTSLELQPRFTLGAGCSGQETFVTRALPGGTRPLVTRFTLGRCHVATTRGQQNRVANYVTEEKYTVTERVLVGYRYERVQVGSHKEQCTKDSSLDGYVWRGVCDVPDYENKRIDVYEDRLVEKVRDRAGGLHYGVATRRLVATVSGSAALEWEDGTTLTVPVQIEIPVEEEAWDYTLPPRRLGGRGERFSRSFTHELTEASLLARASSSFGQQASREVHAAVRAHRAKLARAAGASATDADQQAEAFLRSVLLDSRTESEAAEWFARTHHLAAPVANALVLHPQARVAPEPAPALASSGAWAPTPLEAVFDGFDSSTGRLERDVDEVTTDSYQSGILPPTEYVSAHVGLVPFDIHRGAGRTSRPAVALAFDMAYGLLEHVSPRYGLVVHDEGGFDMSLGLRAGGVERVTYDDGKESGLSLRFELNYALFAGVRTPWFGVFAGANAGYAFAYSGDTVARGGHLEPSVRLGLRFWRTTQLLLEASGFVPLVGSVARRDRLAVSFPLSGRDGLDLRLSWERTVLPTRALAADGETDVELAPHALQFVGLQVGMRM